MEFKVLSSEEYNKIIRKLDEVLELLSETLKKSRNPLEEIWLDTFEAAKILKVSTRTLQNYRDKGTLPFSKIGSKIYFKASDIENLLTEHYIKS
jgi:excisionase family DNA binding protein